MKSVFLKIISVIMVIVSGAYSVYNGVAGLFSMGKDLIPLSGSSVISESDPVYLTAHRGVCSQAPQNTIPAFELAVEYGYYSAETDIRLTSDNVWVISHNSNIEKWYNGKAEVSETTYADLLKYKADAGSNYQKYGTLRIPRLDEYLDVFVGSSTRPQIEIKTTDNKGLDEVVELLKEKGLEKQAIIISFTLSQLKYIRSIDSEIELWYLCDSPTDEVIEQALSVGGDVWLSCNFESSTVEQMKHSKDSGVPISAWTVDTIKDADMMYKNGFRYLETDRLSPQ